MFCWHRWSMWSDPRNTVLARDDDAIGACATAQYRSCLKCGKAQVRRLPRVRSMDGLETDPERTAHFNRMNEQRSKATKKRPKDSADG